MLYTFKNYSNKKYAICKFCNNANLRDKTCYRFNQSLNKLNYFWDCGGFELTPYLGNMYYNEVARKNR